MVLLYNSKQRTEEEAKEIATDFLRKNMGKKFLVNKKYNKILIPKGKLVWTSYFFKDEDNHIPYFEFGYRVKKQEYSIDVATDKKIKNPILGINLVGKEE